MHNLQWFGLLEFLVFYEDELSVCLTYQPSSLGVIRTSAFEKSDLTPSYARQPVSQAQQQNSCSHSLNLHIFEKRVA